MCTLITQASGFLTLIRVLNAAPGKIVVPDGEGVICPRTRHDDPSRPRPPGHWNRGKEALVAKAKQNLKGRPFGRPFFRGIACR